MSFGIKVKKNDSPDLSKQDSTSLKLERGSNSPETGFQFNNFN